MRKYSGTRRETIPLKFLDFFVDIYAKLFYRSANNKLQKETAENNDLRPIHILIASLGHLGDALTVTYIFPLIKKMYPNAIIDLLVPDWCGAVVETNPFVRNIFYINHYYANRRSLSFNQKLKNHYQTFREVLPLLQKETYDYYLDIRYSDSVAHFVLPYIRVKKAYGFARRGMGGLLTKEFEVPTTDEFHHFDMYLMLLREIGVSATLEEVIPYFSIPITISPETISQKITLPVRPFILIFPETGAAKKELSLEYWQQIVIALLEKSDKSVLFCGQTLVSATIIKGVNKATNQRFSERMVDTTARLSIDELAFLSKLSDCSITLDSFPAHLCCIFGKTIMLFKVTGYPFFPIANFPVLLIHGHEPSVGTEQNPINFPRNNVEIIYRNPMETPEVKEMIVNYTATL